jgi:hypothetical protein
VDDHPAGDRDDQQDDPENQKHGTPLPVARTSQACPINTESLIVPVDAVAVTE